MSELNALYFDWRLAKHFGGINKAVILEFIRWSVSFKTKNYDPDRYFERRYFAEDSWWMQDSIEAWKARMPWVSERSMRRYINELVEEGFIFRREVYLTNGGREPNFYRLNHELINKILHSEESVLTIGGLPKCENPPLAKCEDTSRKVAGSSSPINHLTFRETYISDQPDFQDSRKTKSGNQDAGAPSDLAFGKSAIDDLHLNNSDLILDRDQGSSLEKQEGHLKRSEDLSNTKTAPTKSKPVKTLVSHWETTDPFNRVFKNMTSLSICKARFDANDYRTFLTGLMESLSLSISELETLSEQWSEYHNERTVKPKVAKSSFRTWVNNYVERRSKNIQYTKSTTNPHRLPNQNEYDHSPTNPKYNVPIDALPF